MFIMFNFFISVIKPKKVSDAAAPNDLKVSEALTIQISINGF